MTKTRSTKSALISSVIALLLCFTMLLGTTFAWFTDSVTSANNIIKSGNLDIELEYWNGTEWKDVNGSSEILDKDALWEPGYTDVVYFKLTNAGSLALKYQLGVNIVSETIGKNVAGDTLKLSDYIMFGVVENINGETGAYANRDAAVAAVTGEKKISAGYTKAGTLVAGAAPVYLAMVVYMPETVGNEANHDGVNKPSIELGVNVFATQTESESEEDSFGKDYDYDAPIVSAPVARPEAPVTLKGAQDVMIELTQEAVDKLPAGVETISISISEPKVDITANTITFESIELVDQDGEVIDLESLNLTDKITVTLPAQTTFQKDTPVMIYHDGKYVANTVVGENGVISYDVAHLCEVTIGAVEEPSEDAATGNIEIGSVSQLFAFANKVNSGDSYAGKTVVLTADIDLNNGSWTPIGNFTYDITTNGDGYVYGKSFQGTFDGQGHTIKNLYVNAPETSGVGLFGYVTDATVRNLTIENVKLNALSHVAAFVARARGTATVTNCKLIGDIDINAYWAYVAGIVGKAYAINLDGCSVAPNGTGKITSENRNAVGSILAWMEDASNVTYCNAQDLKLTGWANIGGITGFVIRNSTVANCSAENLTLTKTRADGIGTIGLAAGGWNGTGITIKDNTFDTITLNGNMVPNDSVNILFGGEFYGNGNASDVTESNNTQTNITDNRVEVTKIADGLVKTPDGSYQVYNANGLSSLSGEKINGNYELVADIDMGGAEFKAMSAWYTSASFNGNGHTISNVKVVSGENDNGTEQASMFFVSTNGALTVSDLILKDLVVETKNIDNGYAAAVIGYCEGTAVMNNVDVVNATITGSKSSGLLIGHLTPAGSLTATDCDVDGSITISDFEPAGHYAGEYVGTIAGNTTLTNCTADAILGGNLKSTNVGTIYGRKVSGTVVVNGATVVTSATELSDAIANGKAVELTQDIDLSKIDLTDAITNDVVINANGHKITTTDAYGIEVTAGKNITISNADVEMTKEGDYITYAAGFKIANGDYAGATITLENCTITMANTDWAYAVNMPASVKNLNLVIDNCTLEGAIAVQCWGDNNTITITDSKLICNYTTNALYTSYCVALQGDGTNNSENNTLVIDNCEFLYSGVDNFNSVIKAAADVSGSNTVTVTNCTYGEKVVAE